MFALIVAALKITSTVKQFYCLC